MVRVAELTKDDYNALQPQDRAFYDLLAGIAKGLRRLADLMERELAE